MPYTGNLLVQKQLPTDRHLTGPSDRHGTDEPDPSLPRGEHTVPSGTGSEFQGTDFDQVVMSGGGMRLDTPASWAIVPPGGAFESPFAITYPSGNPHDSDAVLSGRGAIAQNIATPLRDRAHDGDKDLGWVRTTFGPPPIFFPDRQEIATDGLYNPHGILADDGIKYVRGINSRPENNPPRDGYSPGYRPGRDRVRVTDPSTFASIHRDIGAQLLHPRDVYVPNPAAPMVASMVTPPPPPRSAPNPDSIMTAATDYTSSPRSVFGGF
jgi:hypothetical protein